MLQTEIFVPLNEFERQLFTRLVPESHFLRHLERRVDFERFRPTLAQYYALRAGRPALDPVLMLKLDLLAVHYRWSDRELMRQHLADDVGRADVVGEYRRVADATGR